MLIIRGQSLETYTIVLETDLVVIFPIGSEKNDGTEGVSLSGRGRNKENLGCLYLGEGLLHYIVFGLNFSFHRGTYTGHSLNANQVCLFCRVPVRTRR